MKYAGNTTYTTGLRIYKRIVINGEKKFILLSWIQRQCIICGRFLDKRSKLYCKRHGYVSKIRSNKFTHLINNICRQYSMLSIRKLCKFPISRYFRKLLQFYL